MKTNLLWFLKTFNLLVFVFVHYLRFGLGILTLISEFHNYHV